MKSFVLIICILISGSIAIDFTTIGQKEIVDYIKNRADLLHGTKLSERNLQDLLSNAVFTGLEEEALVFAYGTSVDDSDLNSDQLQASLAVLASSTDSTDKAPLRILLTSDTLGTTSIALGELTTTKSSSSKSSVGDFIVDCVKHESSDSTSLDGSITISLGGATNSNNLTLTKTIYLAAEVNVTSLGSNWEPSSSSLLTDEGRLLSMLNSKEGSLYIVTYQSLIRETINADEGDLFGGLKSSGKVLVVVNSDGVVSLSGRTISGKIEATWENEAQELVNSFLTLNGSKSRKYMISDLFKSKSNNFVAYQPWTSKDIVTNNWLYRSNSEKSEKSNTISYGRHDSGSRGNRKGNSKSSQGLRYGGSRDDSRRDKAKNSYRSSWKASCSDGSTWPSWRSFLEFGYGYRYGWRTWRSWKGIFDWDFDWDIDQDDDWTPSKHEPRAPSTTPKPVKTTKKPVVTPATTPKPVKTTKKPVVTTPQPIETSKPVVTIKIEPEVTTVPIEIPSTTVRQESIQTTEKPEIKPDLSEPALPDLPKGTTVSLWSTRII